MIVFKCKCSNHTAFILCKDKSWFQINPLPYNFPRLSFLKVFCVFWLTIVFGRTGYPVLRMSNSNFDYNCNYTNGFSVQTSGLSDIRYCRIFKRKKNGISCQTEISGHSLRWSTCWGSRGWRGSARAPPSSSACGPGSSPAISHSYTPGR